jgi:hypothetical protein
MVNNSMVIIQIYKAHVNLILVYYYKKNVYNLNIKIINLEILFKKIIIKKFVIRIYNINLI